MAHYEAYWKQQLLPAQELLLRMADVQPGERVLGTASGTGLVTFPAAAAVGESGEFVATDISQEALKIAQENAERHEMANRIRFLRGDWLDPVVGETFDLIVSNPPYLAEAERSGLAPELAHEPERALFSGPDGLDALRRIVAGAGGLLAPAGGLVVEIAPGQEAAVLGLCRAAGLEEASVHRDLGGRPRAIAARRAGAVAVAG